MPKKGMQKVLAQVDPERLWYFPGLPDSPPRMRFFTKKQQFEHKFQELLLELDFCSRKYVLFCFHFRFLENLLEKVEKVNVKST